MLYQHIKNRKRVDQRKTHTFLCLPSLQVCGISLPLPPKKLIGNMDREFIAERQRGLQTYLDSITQHPLLCSSLPVKKFLDPNNYSANYTGLFTYSFYLFLYYFYFTIFILFHSTKYISS